MKEGFWSSTNKPIPNGIRIDQDIIELLTKLCKLESIASKRRFKGSSKCRVCGQRNGSVEFTYKGWTWPSGFKHYIEDHWVRPSKDFISLVLSMPDFDSTDDIVYKLSEEFTRRRRDGR